MYCVEITTSHYPALSPNDSRIVSLPKKLAFLYANCGKFQRLKSWNRFMLPACHGTLVLQQHSTPLCNKFRIIGTGNIGIGTVRVIDVLTIDFSLIVFRSHCYRIGFYAIDVYTGNERFTIVLDVSLICFFFCILFLCSAVHWKII